jgi:hypothetical protein
VVVEVQGCGDVTSRPLVGARSSATSWSSCFLFRSCRQHFLLGAFPKLPQATVIFVVSACLSAWNTSGPSGRIFLILGYFFECLWRKFFSDGTRAQFNTSTALIHISQLAILVGLPFQRVILHLLICVFTQFNQEKIQVSVKSVKKNGYFT